MDWPTAWSVRCRAFESLQSNALGKHGPKKYGGHFSHFCIRNNPQSWWCRRSLFFGVRCEWTYWSQLGLLLILRSGGADLDWAWLGSWALSFRSSLCPSSDLLQASHSWMRAEVMQLAGIRREEGISRQMERWERKATCTAYFESQLLPHLLRAHWESKHMPEPQADEIHYLWWRQWPNSIGKSDAFDSPAYSRRIVRLKIKTRLQWQVQCTDRNRVQRSAYKSVCYVCVPMAALHIDPSVPSF